MTSSIIRFPAARVLGPIALVVVYALLEWASYIHEYKGVPITPWNPGVGVMFAMMILRGPLYAVALFAGVVVSELFVLKSELGWYFIIGIAGSIAGGYLAAALIARNYFRINVSLRSLYDVLALLAAGTLGACLVAVLLTLLFLSANALDLSDLTSASVPLLIGDLIGVAVMTPLVLRLALLWREKWWRWIVPLLPEMAAFGVFIALALWWVVGGGPAGFKFFYVLFLPVVAAALRHGLDGGSLCLASIQLGLVGLLHYVGYGADEFLDFQALMLVLTATGLIIGVEVSERKSAEARLKEKENEAALATRFNLVSGMASAIAHEINQPMTAARALGRSAQKIMAKPNADIERANDNLTSMVTHIDHASGIVRRMREFLRRGQPHSSTINVQSMLNDAMVLIRAQANADKVRLELNVPSGLPSVIGDQIQLQQVILNLVRNGIDSITAAKKDDGLIRISVRLLDTRQLEIAVSDNGGGISPEIAKNLFDPLTTTKQDGLGLGLSISSSIVKAHGGQLVLQSHLPRMTEFRVLLPLH
jgi:two-component system, LuxR family, sensor kinase FixL